MNDVVFVMVNSRINKKKQIRKTNDYDNNDFSSDDDWIAGNVKVKDNSILNAQIEVGEDVNGVIRLVLH